MNRRMIRMEHPEATAKIFGSFDRNATMIEEQFGVTVRNRAGDAGDSIVIEGENADGVNAAAQCVSYLHGLCSKTDVLSEQSVQYAIDMVRAGQAPSWRNWAMPASALRQRESRSKQKRLDRSSMSTGSKKTPSCLGLDLPERARPFLPWQWRSALCEKSRSAALF